MSEGTDEERRAALAELFGGQAKPEPPAVEAEPEPAVEEPQVEAKPARQPTVEQLMLARSAEQEQRRSAAWFGIEANPEATVEDTGPPDFDGGAREPHVPPSDPEAEHRQTLLELAAQSGWLRGGW